MSGDAPWDQYAKRPQLDAGPWDDYAKPTTASRPLIGQRPATDETGDFMRGFKRTLPEAKQLIGGTMAAIGDVTGWDGLRDKGVEIYKNQEAALQPLTKDTDSASNAWEQVKQGNIGAGIDFLQNAAGYTAGQALESLASTAAGAAIGGAATPELAGVGAIPGAVGGFLARGVIKREAKHQAEKIIAEQVAKGVAKADAKKVAADYVATNTARPLIEQQVAKQYTDAQLRKMGGRAIGAAAGAQGMNTVMELGSVYPEALQKAQDEGRELTPEEKLRAVGGSLAAAGIESAADLFNLGKLAKGFREAGSDAASTTLKQAAKNYGKRAAIEVPEGMAREAGTEAVQTELERYGAGQDLTGPEAMQDVIDSAAVGAVGGGMFGAGAAVNLHSRPKIIDPITNQTSEMPDASNGPISRAVNAAAENGAVSTTFGYAAPHSFGYEAPTFESARPQIVTEDPLHTATIPSEAPATVTPLKFDPKTGEQVPFTDAELMSATHDYLNNWTGGGQPTRGQVKAALTEQFGHVPTVQLNTVIGEVKKQRDAGQTSYQAPVEATSANQQSQPESDRAPQGEQPGLQTEQANVSDAGRHGNVQAAEKPAVDAAPAAVRNEPAAEKVAPAPSAPAVAQAEEVSPEEYAALRNRNTTPAAVAGDTWNTRAVLESHPVGHTVMTLGPNEDVNTAETWTQAEKGKWSNGKRTLSTGDLARMVDNSDDVIEGGASVKPLAVSGPDTNSGRAAEAERKTAGAEPQVPAIANPGTQTDSVQAPQSPSAPALQDQAGAAAASSPSVENTPAAGAAEVAPDPVNAALSDIAAGKAPGKVLAGASIETAKGVSAALGKKFNRGKNVQVGKIADHLDGMPASDRRNAAQQAIAEQEYRLHAPRILGGLSQAEYKTLRTHTGKRGAEGFQSLPMDEQAKAYGKFVAEGGRRVDVPKDYNAHVRAEEQAADIRRAERPNGDIGNPKRNGEPFKTPKAAQATLDSLPNKADYGVYSLGDEFVLRPVSKDTGIGAHDKSWVDQKAHAERMKSNEMQYKARNAEKKQSKPSRAVKEDPKTRRPLDLLDVIARSGGLNREAFRAQGVDPADLGRKAGFYYIFRKKGGMTLDQLREWMQQENYLPRDPENAPPLVDHNDAFDLFDRAFRGGEKIYSDDQQEQVSKYQQAQRQVDEEYQADIAQEPEETYGIPSEEIDPFALDSENDRAFAREIAALTDQADALGASNHDIVNAGFDATDDVDHVYNLNQLVRRLSREREAQNQIDERAADGRGRGGTDTHQESERGSKEDFRGTGQGHAAGQEVSASTGLFGAPSARDHVDAARRNKDAARDGRTGTGRTDMAAGDGELFAGRRPEQIDIEGSAVDRAAAEAATSPTNDLVAPTEAQKEAGNFKVGRIRINGLDLSIEHPAGVKRNPDHEKELQHAYGYIRRTEGADGEKVDAFLGPNATDESLPVFVVDQLKKDGSFDEHKVMLGFKTEQEARDAYASNYPADWEGLGAIKEMTHDQFKDWVQNPKKTAKPAVPKARAARAEPVAPEVIPKTRLVGGVRQYVGSSQTAQAFFQPGRIVKAYAGQDRVLEFEPAPEGDDFGRWRVKVQAVDKDGNDLPGERPRWHSTFPGAKELRSVLGDPAQYSPKALKEQAAAAKAEAVSAGKVGMKLGTGEVVLTASGRKTTPFPKVTVDTDRKQMATVKRADAWLMENALAEAQSRGDEFNAQQFQSSLSKPTQADKDAAEEYLFGEQPEVLPPITKPLVADAAPAAPESSPDSLIASQNGLFRRLHDGDATLAEYKAGWAALQENRDAVLAHLNTLKKSDLVDMAGPRYKSEKKDSAAAGALRALENRYAIGRSLSYAINFDGRDARHDAVAKLVADATDADIANVAKEAGEYRKEREQRVAGAKDPRTLAEFDDAVRMLGSETKLTDEQRARFDALRSDARRDQRDAEAKRNATIKQVQTGDTGMTLVETKHTKKGHDLFVVKMDDRVERDVYNSLNSAAKRLGGMYSSYRGNGAVPGFQFRTKDAAEQFMALREGNVDASAQQQARAEAKAESRAESLSEKADALRAKAEESLGRERKDNTARRAAQAASAEGEARKQIALADTMGRLAQAIDAGTAKMLQFVRHRSQVEMLERQLKSLHWDHLRANGVDWEKAQDAPITEAAIVNGVLPSFHLTRGDASVLVRKLAGIRGGKQMSDSLAKLIDYGDEYAKAVAASPFSFMLGRSDGGIPAFATKREAEAAIRGGHSSVRGALPVKVDTLPGKEKWLAVRSPESAIEKKLWMPDYDKKVALSPAAAEKFIDLVGIGSNSPIPYWWQSHLDTRKQFAKLGIEKNFEFREAMREYLASREAPKGEDRVRKLERDLAGRKDVGNDFFPTPPAVVDRLIEQADIGPGMRVLEPSAGKGDIAVAMRDAAEGVQVDTGEMSSTLRDILEAKGFDTKAGDFLEHPAEPVYDRIVMNPPFGNDSGAAHVQHAYDMLKPGGRLVAVMGEGARGKDAFDAWLEKVGGIAEPLPAGSFKSSFRPTGVATKVVVIDKAGSSISRAPLFSMRGGVPVSTERPADALRGDVKVSVITQQSGKFGSVATPKARDLARRRAFEWLQSIRQRGTRLTNAHTNLTFGFSARGNRELKSWTSRPEAIELIAALPAITKHGIVSSIDTFMRDGGRRERWATIYAPVNIGGELRVARVVAHDSGNGLFLYDLQNSEILKSANPAEAGSGSRGVPATKAGATSTEMTVAQLREAVNSDPRSEWQFSKDSPAGTGIGIDRARALLSDLTKNWGENAPNVVLVKDADELRAIAKREGLDASGIDDLVEGMYQGKPTVWINAGAIKSEDRFRKVLTHEALGHYGVERVVGKAEWKSIAAAIDGHVQNGTGAADLKAAIAQLRRTQSGIFEIKDAQQRRETIAKEVIAVMAENGSKNGLVMRVIAAIRKFLRQIMPGQKWSDAEIRDLIHQADRFMRASSAPAARAATVRANAFSQRADVFHSAMLESVDAGKGAPKKADATAWKGWLDGAVRRGEFKQAERDWLGVDDWLAKQDGQVTRAELSDFIRANQVQLQDVVLGEPTAATLPDGWRVDHDPEGRDGTQYAVLNEDDEAMGFGSTEAEALEDAMDPDELMDRPEIAGMPKYGKYQLPGGQNYRELLMTLPSVLDTRRKKLDSINDRLNALVEKHGVPIHEMPADARAEAERISEEYYAEADGPQQGDDYRSGHFDQPNILAHVRFNERTDADGKKVLFLEEIQSDWHQEGRKRGYQQRDGGAWEVFDPLDGEPVASFDTEAEAKAEAARRDMDYAHQNNDDRTPNAPFKGTDEWAMLAFKRMVRWAAEHGFDSIAWTTGEQQAARYDLSKQISRVEYRPAGTGKVSELTAYSLDGRNAVLDEKNVTPEQIEDYVGKEVAMKLLDSKPVETGSGRLIHSIDGDGLKVGGTGMKGFYDKILPSAVNKWAKKFGAKVGETSLSTDERRHLPNADRIIQESGEPENLDAVHAIDITPAMRDAAFAGQPLFSRAADANEAEAQMLAEVDKAMDPFKGSTRFERAKAWLSDLTPAKVKDAARGHWLGYLTLSHLVELAGDRIPGIQLYGKLQQEMAGMRSQLEGEGDVRARKWQVWAGKNLKEFKKQVDLMHDATIMGVDPAEDYQPLTFKYGGQTREVNNKNVKEGLKALKEQARGLAGDSKQDIYDEMKALRAMQKAEPKRKAGYPELRARWEALSPKAKDHYVAVRNMYRDRSDMTEQLLIDRINNTDANDSQKRRLIKMVRQQFEKNRLQGVYFPLQRYGDYFVAAKKGEFTSFTKYETLNEAARGEKSLKDAGWTITASGMRSEQKASQAPPESFVADVIKIMKAASISEKTQDDVYQAFLETLPELSMRKHQIHRKNVPGFDPDAIRAFAHNMRHNSTQLARLKYSPMLTDQMTNMEKHADEMRKDPKRSVKDNAAADAILGELSQRHEWLMNPQDSKLAGKLTGLGFIYYLGLSPASAITNLTQTPIITFPYLAARYGAGKAAKALAGASKYAGRSAMAITKDSVNDWTDKDPGFKHHDRVQLTNPDEQRALKELEQAGALDRTQSMSLAGIAEHGMKDYSPTKAKALSIVGYGFHITEVMNREATGLATYRLARAAGDSHAAAVQAAIEAINQTHYNYSNANRARFMQSGMAKTILLFRQYALNTTWHWGRMLWNATKAVDPETRKVARRNIAGLVGMTGLFSGALGLPITGLLTTVLNAVASSLGDDDEPWDAATEFGHFLDDVFGKGMSDVIQHGAVNKLTGVDIAGRVGMADMWYRESNKDLTGRPFYDYLLEQAAGPAFDMLGNFMEGKQLIDEGHLGRGVEKMVPNALKYAMRSYRYATEGVTNINGQKIVDDLSTPERAAAALGFTPAKVSAQYEENSALKGYEKFVQKRRQSLMDAYALASRLGDSDGKADVLKQVRAFNQKWPQIAITGKTLSTSLRAHLRADQETEKGIRLTKKLGGAIRDRVTSDEGDEG